MGYRTIVISKRCKLDYRMGYMEVRESSTRRVLLSEIDLLVIENPAVSLTGILLEKLLDEKIDVVFCDSTHNPMANLIPLYGSVDCSRKLRTQIAWPEKIKGEAWTVIVAEKIRKQAEYLHVLGYEAESGLIRSYLPELQYRDATNREGHSAKVYFNALFGMDFTRNQDTTINAALNYGYALLLSIVNREVVAKGYNTQLGFFHDNIFNPFNLSSDLMEPFRIVVDRFVYNQRFASFGTEEKHRMLELFQTELGIDNTRQYFTNAVKIYVKSVFDAINENDMNRILFYRL